MLSLATAASAQSLPRWTAEVTGGVGPHTMLADRTLFFDEPEAVVRVGLGYRVAGDDNRALVAKLDYVTDGNFGEKAICAVSPLGGCYSRFDSGRGASFALGVRQRLPAGLIVGAAAGVGQYVGATGGDGFRPHVEGDIALLVLPHLAVVGLARYARWSRDGESYWYAPFMLGLQIH